MYTTTNQAKTIAKELQHTHTYIKMH